VRLNDSKEKEIIAAIIEKGVGILSREYENEVTATVIVNGDFVDYDVTNTSNNNITVDDLLEAVRGIIKITAAGPKIAKNA